MDQKTVKISKSRPRPIPRLSNVLNRDRVRDRDQRIGPRPRLFVRDRESRQCLIYTQFKTTLEIFMCGTTFINHIIMVEACLFSCGLIKQWRNSFCVSHVLLLTTSRIRQSDQKVSMVIGITSSRCTLPEKEVARLSFFVYFGNFFCQVKADTKIFPSSPYDK